MRTQTSAKKGLEQVIRMMGVIFFSLIVVLGPIVGLVGLWIGVLIAVLAFIASPVLAMIQLSMGYPSHFSDIETLVIASMLCALGLAILPVTIKATKLIRIIISGYVTLCKRVIE